MREKILSEIKRILEDLGSEEVLAAGYLAP
jgi:hypothetical protein